MIIMSSLNHLARKHLRLYHTNMQITSVKNCLIWDKVQHCNQESDSRSKTWSMLITKNGSKFSPISGTKDLIILASLKSTFQKIRSWQNNKSSKIMPNLGKTVLGNHSSTDRKKLQRRRPHLPSQWWIRTSPLRSRMEEMEVAFWPI